MTAPGGARFVCACSVRPTILRSTAMIRAPAVESPCAPRVSLSKPSAAADSAVDERELVRAARAGDRVAYGVLYERYAPMVHGVLLARVAPEFVDDLLQDVFLKALTQLRGLRQDDHFGGWIAAIAR